MHGYLDDHQKKAVVALENIKLICERHKITYYLLAGSTLGAVRNQGFIPWDEDIDIGVFKDGWYRLRKILLTELPPEFVYIDNILDPDFPKFPGKILYQGKPVIDIFMLVKWPSNTLQGNLHWQIKKVGDICYRFSIKYKGYPPKNSTKQQMIIYYIKYLFKNIIYSILHCFYSRDDFLKMVRSNESFFINRKTDFYINLYSVYSMEKEMIKKEWLESPSLVTFEGETYPTVSDTDAYLTHLYGDYMTLPPLEKRVKHFDELVINYTHSNNLVNK